MLAPTVGVALDADSTFEDVEQVVKPSPLEILGETLDRHKFRPSIGQALLLGYLLGREAQTLIGNPDRMREWAEMTIGVMASTGVDR